MIVRRSLTEVRREANSVVTVGTFDGVHLAHQEIIRDVINRAKIQEGRSVVVTFEPHPKEVIGTKPDSVELLTTLEERVSLIGKLGVDLLLVIDFSREFSQLSPREFYRRYVVEGVGVSEVVVGYDHMFGHNRSAGIDELVHMGREFNFSVSAMHPFRIQGEVVSSTQVRKALGAGDISRATKLLGYPYVFSGSVVRGDGRGRTLGYPTANIRPASNRKLIPGHGVYLVGVTVRERRWYGMMNIGVRPTVANEGVRVLEVHIFDMNEDIYGENVVITFLRRLREERRFDSLQALTTQLDRDREVSLRLIAEMPKYQTTHS
jgi:riboflavin kinase/FMN adenylyltransferase